MITIKMQLKADSCGLCREAKSIVLPVFFNSAKTNYAYNVEEDGK